MLIKRIAILGGTGFVGRSLCNRLTREGYHLKVLTRNREYNRNDVILLPNLDLIETNVHDQEQLTRELAGCDAVINLIGILNEKGNNGKGFNKVHVELVEKLIAACHINGIRRILQMSALNADAENGKSYYLRSKGKAEEMLHSNSTIHVTSFQPSVIFGRHDSFFNRFAKLLRITPVFFPLACHATKFSPVSVLDVVEVMTQTIKRPDCYNKKYPLCGPNIYTLEDLVRYTAETIGVNRIIIPLNDLMSRLQAAIFNFVPGKPFSTDNYLTAKTDSVCKQYTLNQFGISPKSIESVVPYYLNQKSYRSDYTLFRSESRR